MRFTKMHGLGNDFLVVDDRNPADLDWPTVARSLCDRRRGVGADGVLLVQRSDVGDLRMRLFNADGSEAEMCGNGIRCVAALARREGWAGERIRWETGAGLVLTEMRGDLVSVDMGRPRLRAAEIPVDAGDDEAAALLLEVGGHELEASCVGMGNPHCVILVEDVEATPVERLGPLVEHHRRFPRRTNVEFVDIVGPTRVRQRTWERGVGETDACGTGACATVVALTRQGRLAPDRPIVVELRGGELEVYWEPGGSVRLTGPAVEVFRGDVDLASLGLAVPSEVGR